MDIHELIKQSLKKNPKAEKELYYLYAKRIFGICRRYTQDNQQAEDYMQDSFVKIFKHLKKYNPEKAAFSTWVSTIVVNTILSDKKRKRIKFFYRDMQDDFHYETADHSSELNDIVGHDIDSEKLITAIRSLPENYSKVLNLYIFENWKHADIAALLKIEASSSRSILTRAKKMLKKKLIHQKVIHHEGKVA